MTLERRILIVEDEILVALDLEAALKDLGAEVVAIANDRTTALDYAGKVDVALVDLNLRDGPTGIDIAQELAFSYNVAVVFITANPAQLGENVQCAVGVMAKPFSGNSICAMVNYLETASGVSQNPQHVRYFN